MSILLSDINVSRDHSRLDLNAGPPYPWSLIINWYCSLLHNAPPQSILIENRETYHLHAKSRARAISERSDVSVPRPQYRRHPDFLGITEPLQTLIKMIIFSLASHTYTLSIVL